MGDVIIIGGGVAGLSAAIFTAKSGLNTIILDKGQSQITRVSSVQNIPGFPNEISGNEWISNARKQVVKFNGDIRDEEALEVSKAEDGSFNITTDKTSYTVKYLIIATNTNKNILSSFGFETVTNQYDSKGKAKSIQTLSWNGETAIDNLYLAGLITEIPSQASIALGHGAAVGINVASKEKGTPYKWHDL